jgi:hypothetical protein
MPPSENDDREWIAAEDNAISAFTEFLKGRIEAGDKLADGLRRLAGGQRKKLAEERANESDSQKSK